MEEKTRKSGIDVIGDVPWGTHLCQFYQTKQDLIDILVPYFKAGLENNEFCMWVTSESLDGNEAEEVMRKAVPNFAQHLERGQIEILPHTEWYLKDGAFNRQRVLGAWIDKLNQALDKGYDGMRVTGDTAWLGKRGWRKFADYEEEINNVISKYRVIAACTYPLDRCGAGEVMDVVRNHQFALIMRGNEWVTIKGSERKRVEGILHESEDKYRSLFENMLDGFAYCKILVDDNNKPIDFVYLEVNDAFERLTGLREEDVVGRKVTEVIPGIKEAHPELFSIYGKVALTGKETKFDVYFKPLKIWLSISVYSPQKGYFIAVFENITERRKIEEDFENIFSLSPDMVGVFTTEGELVKVNPSWETILGYKTEELLKMGWAKLVHPDDVERTSKEVEEQLKGSPVVSYINRYKCKDGSYKTLEWQATFAKKGIVYATARDITELKRARENQETTSPAASGRNVTPQQERAITVDLDDLSDREAVVLLLGLCLPAGESRKLAKQCVKEFKNLRGFLSASPHELEQAGISPQGISYIKLVHEIPAKVLKEKITDKPVYQSPGDVIDYLNYSMRDLKKEVFKVIYLNNRNQIIDAVDLFEGTVESTPIRPREIVETAINCNATGLIFAHNHPSGDPTSSKSDKQITRDLVFMGMVLQIRVLDHIIIGVNTHFSFADEGLIKKYEDNFLNLRIRSLFDGGADYSADKPVVSTLCSNR